MCGGFGSGTLAQHADHGLGGRQPPRTEQHQHAIAGALEHRHLAELGVVVHARVGARVAGQDEPFFKLDADAVGHACHHVGPDLEAFERVRAEGAGQRDIAGVAAARDQHATDARRVVACVEGVPAVAEIGLEPGREVHRPVGRLGADVAEVAGAIARRDVHAAAQRNRQVRIVTAHAAALVVGLQCGARGSRMRVAELDVLVHEVADGLHARPAGRPGAEPLPGDLGQAVGLAIAAAQQVDQRRFGQHLDRCLHRPRAPRHRLHRCRSPAHRCSGRSGPPVRRGGCTSCRTDRDRH